MTRAYRRPATTAEVERLAGFVELVMKDHGTFLDGIQTAVQAVLCSPRFLYRWELDPEAMKPGDVRDLSDYEVASRLSYFLWSSMPDDELLALATVANCASQTTSEAGRADAAGLESARFREQFAGQWLQIRNIWEVGIDPGLLSRSSTNR